MSDPPALQPVAPLTIIRPRSTLVNRDGCRFWQDSHPSLRSVAAHKIEEVSDMAITVKPVSSAADKLVQRAQAASGEYAERAAQSGEKFAANAAAAKGNYGQAITAGGIPDRWARGIAKAGGQGYVNGVVQKGRDRFSQGVTVGKYKYVAGVG